jgi:hypothetical protein
MVIEGRFPPFNALLQLNTDGPNTFMRGLEKESQAAGCAMIFPNRRK